MEKLSKLSILFLVFIILFAGCVRSDTTDKKNWNTLKGRKVLEKKNDTSGFGNPKDFIASGDTVLYVSDWALNGLHKYDLRTGKLSQGTGIGPGPGEIRDESAYSLARLTDGRIWLHDRKQGRITLYGPDLNPVEDITISGSMRSLPLSDTLFVTVPQVGKVLAEVRTFQNRTERIKESNSPKAPGTYHSDEAEVFKAIPSNYTLKYGPAASCGKSVVIGFEFASPLIRVRKDTIDVLKGTPETIKFPVQPDLPEGQVRLPNWFNPLGTLDLACDRTHIYALFSGKGVSRSKVRRLSLTGNLTGSKRAELSARTKRTNRLHVYDRTTGTFTYEIKLPVKARQVAASKESLYLLTHEKDGPHILRYTWTDAYISGNVQ